MPVLREQDFDKMAARVVDQFFGGKAKLAEAAAQEAMGAGLNPDQIERLVQSANTMAVLRMMDQQKQQGAGDLTQEFDTIDPRHVIRIVIDEAGVHVDPGPGGDMGAGGEMMGAGGPPQAGGGMEMPHAEGGGEPPMPPQHAAMPPHGDPTNDLPDEMSAMHGAPPEGAPGHEEMESPEEEVMEQDGPFGKFTPKKEKKESKPEGKKDDKKDAKKDNGDKGDEGKKDEKKNVAKEARMRKLAGILEDQRRQAELVFDDRFEQLCARFKRAHVTLPFEMFEKDAMSEFNDDVGIAVMNSLRERFRKPALVVSEVREKTAALGDHHISDDTPELRMFEELRHIVIKSAELERGVAWLRSQCV